MSFPKFKSFSTAKLKLPQNQNDSELLETESLYNHIESDQSSNQQYKQINPADIIQINPQDHIKPTILQPTFTIESNGFILDTRGDPQNLFYFSNNSSTVPNYSRIKTILGTNFRVESVGKSFIIPSSDRASDFDWRAFNKKGLLIKPSGPPSVLSDYVTLDIEYERNDESLEVDPKVAEFNRALLENPKDISVWKEFIRSQPLSAHEKKASIYQKAMTFIEDPELILGYISEYSEYSQVKDILVEWDHIIEKKKVHRSIWLGYVNARLSIQVFSMSDMEEVFKHVWNQAGPGLDLIEIFTRAFVNAGYPEKAIGIYQAIIEFSLFVPDSIKSRPFEKKIQFKAFWESGVSRIGELDAKGWLNSSESTCHSNEHIPPFNPQSTDQFNHLYLIESYQMKHNWFPLRPTHQITDPFKIVLFEDIQDYLANLPNPLSLIESFIQFFYPHPILAPVSSHNRNIYGPTKVTHAYFEKQHVVEMEKRFSGSIKFVKRMIEQTSHFIGNIPSRILLLSFDACQSLKSMKKQAKLLFSSEQPPSLWIGYAFLLVQYEQFEEASKVYEMVLGTPVESCFDCIKQYTLLLVKMQNFSKALNVLIRGTDKTHPVDDTAPLPLDVLKAMKVYEANILRYQLGNHFIDESNSFVYNEQTQSQIDLISCHILIQYIQTGIETSHKTLISHLNQETNLLSRELIYQDFIDLAYSHGQMDTLAPVTLEHFLYRPLSEFHANTYFMSIMSWNMDRQHVVYKHRKRINELITLYPNSSPLFYFAIENESSKPHKNNGIIQSLFDRCITLMKREPAFWKSYIDFIHPIDSQKAKKVYYRSIGECVYNKELYVLAFGLLGFDFEDDEKQELVEIMYEKEIRLNDS